MKNITVKRTVLIEKLKERLEATKETNVTELEEWRKEAIAYYTNALKNLKDGKTFFVNSSHPPRDEENYNISRLKRAIAELELSIDENIKVPTNSTYLNLIT